MQMTVFLLYCLISTSGGAERCQPPIHAQPSWEACMAQSDERNKLIARNSREKMWPNNWQYVCDARATTQL